MNTPPRKLPPTPVKTSPPRPGPNPGPARSIPKAPARTVPAAPDEHTLTDRHGNTIAPAIVPQSYASLGVTSGWDPTPWQQMRITILGPIRTGKTFTASSNPRAMVWDTEDSARDSYRGSAARVHIRGMTQIIGQGGLLERLEADATSATRPFDHVAIDTFDKFIELAIDYLSAQPKYATKCDRITEYGTKGSGWFILRDFLIDILNRIYAAGYGWTITGHLTEKKEDIGGNSVSVIKPVMAPSIAEAIFRDTQFIFLTDRKTVRRPGTVTRTLPNGKKMVQKTMVAEAEYVIINDTPEKDTKGLTKGRYMKNWPAEIPVKPGLAWATLEAVYYSCIEKEQETPDSDGPDDGVPHIADGGIDDADPEETSEE